MPLEKGRRSVLSGGGSNKFLDQKPRNQTLDQILPVIGINSILIYLLKKKKKRKEIN